MNLPSPSDTPWRTSILMLALALVLAALSGAALRVDMPLARLQDSIDAPGDLSRLIVLSEAFAYGGTVILIVLAAVTLDPRGWRVAPRLLLLAYGSGVIANTGKLLLVRTRPREADLDGSVLDTFGGWLPPLTGNEDMQSFPSGHTATAVGLAIALTMLYPRGWWLFGMLALLAATQRIDSQAHYLSDVLAGAAIGFLVASLVTAPSPLARWLEHLEQQNTRASFGPRPDA
jgi:membrane-associated phospholipid phosphatase